MKMQEYLERLSALALTPGSHSMLADAIEKLLGQFDKDREPIADAAQYLWKTQVNGDWRERLENAPSESITRMAGSRQNYLCGTVADCAQKLFSFGFAAYWLRMASKEVIIAQANGSRDPIRSRAISYAIDPYEFQIRWDYGSFVPPNPVEDRKKVEAANDKRKNVADAAEFLAVRVGIGQYWLSQVSAADILADARELLPMFKSKEVLVEVVVESLGSPSCGGYVTLDFFKGEARVGGESINGKCQGAKYRRVITLSDDYDMVRQQCAVGAVFSYKRVQK